MLILSASLEINNHYWRNKMGFLNHVKTAWNGQVRCDWCGKYYKQIDGDGLFGSAGGLVGRAVATAKKNYCSKACKLAAEEAKAEKKVDFEERKAKGELTEMKKIKDQMAQPFEEAKQQMKDSIAQPMNEVKSQMKGAFGSAFGGIFGKK